MINSIVFGPFHGLPDASPFVLKAMTLLKLAGLDYVDRSDAASRARLRASCLISTTMEPSSRIRPSSASTSRKRDGVDFDVGLTTEQRAQAWAIEKMCEDHLYWVVVSHALDRRRQFRTGTAQDVRCVPASDAAFASNGSIRRKIAKSLVGPGNGTA